MQTIPLARNLLAVGALLSLALLGAAGCPAPNSTEPPPKIVPEQPIDDPPAPAPSEPEASPTHHPPTTSHQPPIPNQPPTTNHQPPTAPEPKPETPTAEPPRAAPDGVEQTAKADPAKAREPLFEGWPRPAAALLISGEQMGYIEPCGCAGLENQKGGLKRRHTLIKNLAAKGWPLVPLDLGGQVRRYGRQAEIKYARTLDGLVQLGYRAVGFGPQELRLPAEHLLSVAANLAGGAKPLVSANVGLFDFDLGYVERFRVVEAGSRKIGVTSILGAHYRSLVNNDGIVFVEPEKALAKIVGPLDEQADFLVLLAHATPEESRALAKKFPQFDVVVTAGGAAEPPRLPEKIEGTDTLLVEVGHKGMYVAVLGLYDDGQTPVRYQRVPLDDRFEDSPAMQQLMVEYQKQLKTLGLGGLGVKPQRHPSAGRFVGSQACADCHTQAWDVWSGTGHAHATQTLVDLTPPRHYDPECLSCHVTGWNPQEYFPYDSGYLSLEKTPLLKANGCENCHGPGSRHVAIELGDLDATDADRDKAREQMRLELVAGEAEGKAIGKVTTRCLECHDLDNSPDFDFKTYWPHVEHHGVD